MPRRATRRCAASRTGGGSSDRPCCCARESSDDRSRPSARSAAAASSSPAAPVSSVGALTRRLVEAGARVTVLDDLFTGRAEAIPTGAEFVEGSVTDQALVDELVAANSLVFHMAARNIIASTANPRDDFATNIGGTLNVLLAARDLEGRPGRLHVARHRSTATRGRSRSTRTTRSSRCPRTRSASSAARTTACRSTRATACRRRSSATRTSTASASDRTIPYCGVVAKFLVEIHAGRPVSSPWRRRADPRLHVHRRRGRSHAPGGRSTRAPKATSSTSGPASRRR